MYIDIYNISIWLLIINKIAKSKVYSRLVFVPFLMSSIGAWGKSLKIFLNRYLEQKQFTHIIYTFLIDNKLSIADAFSHAKTLKKPLIT